MELTAVLHGLESLSEAMRVRVVTDSKYVHEGLTEWVPLWLDGNRLAMRRRRNRRLWERVASCVSQHDLTCEWIRSHRGWVENEFVDQLARRAALIQSAMAPQAVVS